MKTMILSLVYSGFAFAAGAQLKPVVFVITDSAKKPISNAVLMLGNTALYKTVADGLAFVNSVPSKAVYKIRCEGYQTRSGIHINPINTPDTVRIILLGNR